MQPPDANHSPDANRLRPQTDHAATPPMPRVIPSGELLGRDREILIEHEGSLYRLRLTRSGKLILHK
jgi:hemin uptake protein HemP